MIQIVTAFLTEHWVMLLSFLSAGILIPSLKKLLDIASIKGVECVHTRLEHLRSEINANEIGAQIQADDAIVDLLEGYIPELIHGLDTTIQTEISQGKFSSLDWKVLGANLWAKGRAEIETAAANYMKTSGEKDGEVLAALVAKKFFLKQSALQKGLIVPHN